MTQTLREKRTKQRIQTALLTAATSLAAIFIILSQALGAQPKYLTASWYSIQSLKEEGTWSLTKGVMANGELFCDNELTCASRDFPMGTMLRITNVNNDRYVIVRVTDRIGERFKGKRIDLSKRAFSQIANLEQGIVKVKITKIRPVHNSTCEVAGVGTQWGVGRRASARIVTHTTTPGQHLKGGDCK